MLCQSAVKWASIVRERLNNRKYLTNAQCFEGFDLMSISITPQSRLAKAFVQCQVFFVLQTSKFFPIVFLALAELI